MAAYRVQGLSGVWVLGVGVVRVLGSSGVGKVLRRKVSCESRNVM